MINTIQPETERIVSSVSARKLRNYLIDNGYGICNVTPITNSRKWFAILTKDQEYIIGTVFTDEKGVERIEESFM